MRSFLPIICGALMALPAGAQAQGAMAHSDAEAAIHAGAEAWSAAWNSGDAAALAALYAEDATVMAPGGEPVTGRGAIEEMFAGAMEANAGSKMEIKPAEVMAADGWATETGSFVQTAADGSHQDHGRYIAVWKDVDGKWLLYRDIWNSSM